MNVHRSKMCIRDRFKAYGRTTEAMCVKANAAMKGSVDEKVKQTYGPRNSAPIDVYKRQHGG